MVSVVATPKQQALEAGNNPIEMMKGPSIAMR
jgi:hypothetical protein